MRRALIALLALAAASCAARERAKAAAAALEATTLAPGWSVDLDVGGPMQIVPAPGGFVVFGAGGEAAFIASEDGSVRWRAALGGDLAGSPVASLPASRDDGWVAVPLEREVRLIRSRDGADLSRWARPTNAAVALSAAPGGVVVVGGDGVLREIDPATGLARWEAPLPSPPADVAATACEGQILAGLLDGRVAGFDSGDGSLRWTKRLRSPAAVAPACAGEDVYVATSDNTLHALRLHRRSLGRRWRVRSGGDPVAPPVGLGRAVLFLSKDTYLYGLRRRNGHLLFRIRLGRRPSPAAILEDLILVSGLQATRLEAYRLPMGLNAGGFDLPEGNRFVTPPVVSGERVALGVARFGETDRSRVIALTAQRPPADPGVSR